MTLDAFLALLVYAFVTSITPGPNNFMLLASGVNFGFAKTIPHMLGISIGFLVLLLAVGFGLGAVLTAFPVLHTALKIAGGVYLLYLAWKIAMSRSLRSKGETKARPMRFIDAAAFQWVSQGLGDGDHRHGRLCGSGASVSVGGVGFDSLHRRQPAERFGVGRFRHGAARFSVGPGAAEMVQHRHGRAAGSDAVADAAVAAVLLCAAH